MNRQPIVCFTFISAEDERSIVAQGLGRTEAEALANLNKHMHEECASLNEGDPAGEEGFTHEDIDAGPQDAGAEFDTALGFVVLDVYYHSVDFA